MREFQPHVTVATVVPRLEDGRFLFVEEIGENGTPVINQPAGHLEANETLVEAAKRETLEETGWQVEITGFLGIALFTAANGITYQRNTFVAEPISPLPNYTLDDGIIQAIWLSEQELLDRKTQWRSPLAYTTLEQYLTGSIFPLSILYS